MEILIDFELPPSKPQALGRLVDLLAWQTRTNVVYLRNHPWTPRLIDSGVRYQQERKETWYDIPGILARGQDDCEGLASWLAAELQVLGGFDAWPRIVQTGPDLYHAVTRVRRPGRPNLYIDPSRILGMGKDRIA